MMSDQNDAVETHTSDFWNSSSGGALFHIDHDPEGEYLRTCREENDREMEMTDLRAQLTALIGPEA